MTENNTWGGGASSAAWLPSDCDRNVRLVCDKKIAKIGENQPSLFNGQAVVYRQILFTARFWRKLIFGGKCKMAVNLRLKGRAKKTKRKI